MERVVEIAEAAGAAIMEVYNSDVRGMSILLTSLSGVWLSIRLGLGHDVINILKGLYHQTIRSNIVPFGGIMSEWAMHCCRLASSAVCMGVYVP